MCITKAGNRFNIVFVYEEVFVNQSAKTEKSAKIIENLRLQKQDSHKPQKCNNIAS